MRGRSSRYAKGPNGISRRALPRERKEPHLPSLPLVQTLQDAVQRKYSEYSTKYGIPKESPKLKSAPDAKKTNVIAAQKRAPVSAPSRGAEDVRPRAVGANPIKTNGATALVVWIVNLCVSDRAASAPPQRPGLPSGFGIESVPAAAQAALSYLCMH